MFLFHLIGPFSCSNHLRNLHFKHSYECQRSHLSFQKCVIIWNRIVLPYIVSKLPGLTPHWYMMYCIGIFVFCRIPMIYPMCSVDMHHWVFVWLRSFTAQDGGVLLRSSVSSQAPPSMRLNLSQSDSENDVSLWHIFYHHRMMQWLCNYILS